MQIRCEEGPLNGCDVDREVETDAQLGHEFFREDVGGVPLLYIRCACDWEDGVAKFRWNPYVQRECEALGIAPANYLKVRGLRLKEMV